MFTIAMEAGSGEVVLALIALGCVIAAYCAGRAQAAKLSYLCPAIKTDPVLGPTSGYYRTEVLDDDARVVSLVFTAREVATAKGRASEVHEDAPEFTD